MSSMSCWTRGAPISGTGTGGALVRSTGCPRRATFRIAIASDERFGARDAVKEEPWAGRLDGLVHVDDVGDARRLEPCAKRGGTLLRENRHAVLPRGPTAEDARVADPGLGRQPQRLREFRVAHTGRQIDERLRGRLRRREEPGLGLIVRVGLLSGKARRALAILHVVRHFALQDR